MPYLNSSKVSLLSLGLLVFAAGVMEIANPYSLKAANARNTESFSELLISQASPSPTSFPVVSTIPSGTKVKIDSSPSLAAISQLLQQKFSQKYPGSELLVNYNGADEVLQSLLTGKTDMAGIGRPLTEAEQSQGLVLLPLVRPKIAVIVGTKNLFSGSLTDEQFAKIFRGEITNWKEVGGDDRPIRFIDRPSNSDTRQALRNYPTFRSAPFQTGASAKQMATEDPVQIIKELGTDGLSYAIVDQITGRADVRSVLMHNTLPTDPRYPYSQPFGYVYKSSNPPLPVQAFLGLASAAENRSAIEAAMVAGTNTPAGIAPNAPTAGASPSGSATGGISPGGGSPASSSPTSSIPPSSSPTSSSPTSSISIASSPASSSLASSSASSSPASSSLASSPASSSPASIAPGTAASPAAALPAIVDSSAASSPSNREGGDATLWWLLLLCLGLPFLLAWLAGKRKNTTTKPSTLILTPETGNIARVYWELSPEKIQGLRQQGGKNLAVRLTDVTNINPQVTNPKVVQVVSCSLGSPLISLEVPEVDREYQAELGCITQDDGWISLAKSAPAYFPAPRSLFGGLGTGIVTAIGSTAIGSLDTPSGTQGASKEPQGVGKGVEKGVEKGVSKVDVIDNSSAVAGVAPVVDRPTSSAAEAKNIEGIDNSVETENTAGIDNSPRETAGETKILDDSVGSLEADIWDDPVSPVATPIPTDAGIMEPEPRSELLIADSEVGSQSSPEAIEPEPILISKEKAISDEIATASIASIASKASESGIADLSHPGDLSPEEVSSPQSSVVPTVDDGGSSLNWGMIGAAAAAGIATQLPKDEANGMGVETPEPRIDLIPSDRGTIDGRWVLPESTKATYKSHGGSQLAMRIYNVTDVDPEMPLTGEFRQFPASETGLTSPLTFEDLPSNPSNNSVNSGTDSEISSGDYQGELGYLTATNQWLGVAKSSRFRLPLGGETQIHLDVHTPDWGYVAWTIAPGDSQILKSQGTKDLRLRIHDVTDIDIDHVPAHDTQEYICEMEQIDRYVPITVGDRPYADYLAELGSITNTGEWRRIIRSLHTRFSS